MAPIDDDPESQIRVATTNISEGVFTRKYRDGENNAVCVAYHTPSQSVAFLEGDSAEVWWRLFSAQGKCDDALSYIRKHGHFRNSDAILALNEFLAQLQESNLINHQKSDPYRRESNVALGVDPLHNPELAIGQYMADHHVFYSLILEFTYRCN